ncbi:hypothetical protein [Nocardioides sp.]|uniref:hypothetical protein n=1 Tax=Nocardioides sp. TaxID=35761 RepID=UPI002734AFC0|nr:hypothetical protein [Nocardioides sp.]MDP3891978.1 hypothetical protein [Nocardioides sp.]
MSTESLSSQRERRRTRLGIAVVVVCVVLQGICLAWAFFVMRDVMGVGGMCAEGGPYEIATPCPDGTWLLSLAIPVLVISMFVGSWVGMSVATPTLLVPMWGLLFGLLGWNFLEFGLRDGIVWGWLVPGVLFEAMAAPALIVIAVTFVKSVRAGLPADERRKSSIHGTEVPAGSLWWWPAYVVLYAAGAYVGYVTYVAAAT